MSIWNGKATFTLLLKMIAFWSQVIVMIMLIMILVMLVFNVNVLKLLNTRSQMSILLSFFSTGYQSNILVLSANHAHCLVLGLGVKEGKIR